MKLHQLIQAYEFEELMPVINEMFPGTTKFRDQLQQAYDLMLKMKPVASKKSITFKIMDMPGELKYMGAEDSCFRCTWEVALGKDISRMRGVDLNDAELLANCLVNLSLQGKYPAAFEKAHQALMRAD